MLDEERELFFDNLSDVLTNSVYRKICSSIDDPSISVNDIVEQFHTVIKQAGEDFRKKPKRNIQNQPPWFDRELNTLKKDKYKALRQFRISLSETDLDAY